MPARTRAFLRLRPAGAFTLDYTMRKLRELLELIFTMMDIYDLIELVINVLRNINF